MFGRFDLTEEDYQRELDAEEHEDAASLETRRRLLPLFEDPLFGVVSLEPAHSFSNGQANDDRWELSLQLGA